MCLTQNYVICNFLLFQFLKPLLFQIKIAAPSDTNFILQLTIPLEQLTLKEVCFTLLGTFFAQTLRHMTISHLEAIGITWSTATVK